MSCHWRKTELKLGRAHSIAAYTQRSHVVAGTKVPVRPVSSLSPSLCVWLQDWSRPWWGRVPPVTHEQSSALHLKPIHFPRGCQINSFCADENPASFLPCSSAQSANLRKNSRSTNSQTALRIILPCCTVYLFPFLLLSPPLGSKITVPQQGASVFFRCMIATVSTFVIYFFDVFFFFTVLEKH